MHLASDLNVKLHFSRPDRNDNRVIHCTNYGIHIKTKSNDDINAAFKDLDSTRQ